MLSCGEGEMDEATGNRDTVSAHSVTVRQKTKQSMLVLLSWQGPYI